MSITRNPPAFPLPLGAETAAGAEGMTLRDYFAAKAMQGMFAADTDESFILIEDKAAVAYEMADAMLAARGDDSPQAADTDALGDLRAYFPDAETLHDCYRRIEELERDAARYRAWRDGSCDEPSRFARALAPCLTPQEIDQALDAMMKEPRP